MPLKEPVAPLIGSLGKSIRKCGVVIPDDRNESALMIFLPETDTTKAVLNHHQKVSLLY
jgi:hypothetical protein